MACQRQLVSSCVKTAFYFIKCPLKKIDWNCYWCSSSLATLCKRKKMKQISKSGTFNSSWDKVGVAQLTIPFSMYLICVLFKADWGFWTGVSLIESPFMCLYLQDSLLNSFSQFRKWLSILTFSVASQDSHMQCDEKPQNECISLQSPLNWTR